MAFDPVTSIVDLVKVGINKFIPDKMDEADKKKLEADMTMFIASQAAAQDSDFRKFVIEYEGAAKDYKNIPIFGPLMMLIRGLIRPGFTYLVGYLDYLYFTAPTGAWEGKDVKLLLVINSIVLAFWFGERALKNSGLVEILLKRQ